MQELTAVVGLGDLGSAVASRVASACPLLLIDPDRAARDRWTSLDGIQVAADVGTASWAAVGRVHVLVRTQRQAADVLDSLDRQLTGSVPVHLHTTVSVDAAVRLATQPRTGIRVLEQPLTGGAAAVRAGGATVLTAGPIDDLDRDWIAQLASHAVSFDDFGQPALAKLINNAAAAATCRVTASLLATAVDKGLDIAAMHTVLCHGSGGSWMAEALPELGVDQARLLVKDVLLLQDHVGELPPLRIDDEDGMLVDLAAAKERFASNAGRS